MADAPLKHRGRGQPPICWSSTNQRKLLRLYMCFKDKRLHLKAILDLMKDEAFNPGLRNAHNRLRVLLASSNLQLDKWRPRDDAAMRNRVRFLRLARAERRLGAWRTQRVAQNSLLKKHRRKPHRSLLCPCRAALGPGDGRMMLVDPRSDIHSVSVSTDQTPPAGERLGALTERIHAQSGLDGRPKAESVSGHSSKRRSLLGSISSGLASMARSSSSASRSAKRSSAGPAEVGFRGPLSRLSRAEFISLFNSTPSGRAPLPILWELRFPRIRKYPSPRNSIELNETLITECCGLNVLFGSPGSSWSDDGLSDSPGCIHKRLSRAIKAQSQDKAFGLGDFAGTLTTAEANAVDDFGNLLIHTAARWGAGIPVLISILRHTDNVSSTNHRGETFLHVYDPPAAPLFDSDLFFDLVKYLRARGFDFCRRDVEKQTMLHRLVTRTEFSVELLHCVFCQLPQGSARFLMVKRSADDRRLWNYVQKNLEQRSLQLKRIFGDEREFVRRYLPEFYGFELEGQTLRTPISAWKAFLASVYGRFVGPQEMTPASQQESADCHPDSGILDVKRTQLMGFLCQAAIQGEEPTTEMLFAKVPKIQRDQSLAQRDREGNTVLHYAAEFGMVTAIKFLRDLKVNLSPLNNCGNTPLQLISYAIQRTDVKSDINMESRYLRCAIILLDAGADYKGQKHVQQPLTKIKKHPDQIFDGSEGQIERLTLQGVARDCKGLHLLTPLRNAVIGRDVPPSASAAL